MKTQLIDVTLESLSDIMFDRFIDHSADKRPPEQKLYLAKDNMVVLPAENIITFMFGETPPGAARTFEGKKSKDYLRIGQGHVHISPTLIPFHDKNDYPIQFKDFDNTVFRISDAAPRTKKGSLSIKMENNPRPVLIRPWFLSFQITLIENRLITDTKLYNWFEQGGLMIGLGNYRPRYGRFYIKTWDIRKEEKKEKQ